MMTLAIHTWEARKKNYLTFSFYFTKELSFVLSIVHQWYLISLRIAPRHSNVMAVIVVDDVIDKLTYCSLISSNKPLSKHKKYNRLC